MSSRKSERLINLTIALLATKRYLSKEEIFRNIVGYEGAEDAKERMFERDKDELRQLGIVIDVGGIDPLFSDEAGYRIQSQKYQLDLGQLNGQELALISLAAESWRGAALGKAAQSAFVKLNSLGITSNFDSLPAMAPKLALSSPYFIPLAHAIDDRCTVTFAYLSAQLFAEERSVQPYGLGGKGGNWYLVGFDQGRKAIRTFRLDRIRDEVLLGNKKGGFDPPVDFEISKFLESEVFEAKSTAIVEIRKGKGYALRQGGKFLSSNDEFDRFEINYPHQEKFIDLVLWHGDDLILIEPLTLRHEVIDRLQKLVSVHG